MQLTVNGKAHEHAGDGTLPSLLDELGARHDRVAVLVNDDVVAREERNSIALSPGDRVEVLGFAGGG